MSIYLKKVEDPNALYMEVHVSLIIWKEKVSTGVQDSEDNLDEDDTPLANLVRSLSIGIATRKFMAGVV